MVASRREDFVDMFELIVRLGCDCDWNAYLCKPICLIVMLYFDHYASTDNGRRKAICFRVVRGPSTPISGETISVHSGGISV